MSSPTKHLCASTSKFGEPFATRPSFVYLFCFVYLFATCNSYSKYIIREFKGFMVARKPKMQPRGLR